jgi:menaquinol-cytochrome c reductase cytochrome b/c subunit
MAVQAAPAGGARSQARNVRAKRERDEEVLVWPDLVFVEFIAAILFLVLMLLLSTVINAPLLDQANGNITPNPSKAPWYFLSLQELLLHMHPALAGVIVPTIALILLAAMPYVDRSNVGQGVWWSGHEKSKQITITAYVFTFAMCWLLVLYDNGAQNHIFKAIFPGYHLPLWLQSVGGGLQGGINWPAWTHHIPYVPLPHGLKLLDTTFLNLNLPAFIAEILIPTAAMIGLPLVLIGIERKLWGPLGMRGTMYVLFSGFIGVYLTLTIIGTAFRGEGQELVAPWKVPFPHAQGLGIS